MSAKFLKKVADVLDALAEQTDKQAQELTDIKLAERKKQLDPIIGKLAFVTGQTEEELSNKLANADESMVEMISKLSNADASAVQLGSPDGTKTAGAKGAADDSFADWILS